MTLESALKKNKLVLDEGMVHSLDDYLVLLQKWNTTYNLTAITDPAEMIDLHLIDSLMMAPYLHGQSCLDVGSGAGLPGIPLAIAHPDQQWTLLDKNGKKTRFMTQAVAELGLKNVQVVQQRSEDFHPPSGFDSILSRAFGSLRLFAETTTHLLNPGGKLLAMKGQYPTDELADLPAQVSVQSVNRVMIQGRKVERHVVCLRLTSET